MRRVVALRRWDGTEFISDPIPKLTEVDGLFSGYLDFATNKSDFDLEVDMYGRTPSGTYVQLSPFWIRANYSADRRHRRLLERGRRERLHFQSVRLTSRQLAEGSRLVVVLRVLKGLETQINYGTGGAVGDETIEKRKDTFIHQVG